jgi:biopolymer transport protein TolR
MAGVRPRGRGRRTMNEINMVPFIDVMLVLLIIFMVTAPLITPSMINLPSVSKAAAQPAQPIQLLINQNNRIEIKPATGAPVASTLAGVGEAVKAMQPAALEGQQPTPVLITADKSVRYEIVVKVMDELNKAGVGRIALSVQTAQ